MNVSTGENNNNPDRIKGVDGIKVKLIKVIVEINKRIANNLFPVTNATKKFKLKYFGAIKYKINKITNAHIQKISISFLNIFLGIIFFTCNTNITKNK